MDSLNPFVTNCGMKLQESTSLPNSMALSQGAKNCRESFQLFHSQEDGVYLGFYLSGGPTELGKTRCCDAGNLVGSGVQPLQ